MDISRRDLSYVAAAVLIIAASIAAAGYFIGHGFYMSRMGDRYVSVKGLAEQDVAADLAIWRIRIAATGNDLAELQGKVEKDRERLISFLTGHGIADDEISLNGPAVTDLLAQQYRGENAAQSRFIINMSAIVRTTDIAKVQRASGEMGDLVKQGLVLQDNVGPDYLFTKLNDIKPALIATATKNARVAAEQFAADSGSRVGPIRRASQGIISIEARDGETNDMGAGDAYVPNTQLKQINKKVRVVSTVDYALED